MNQLRSMIASLRIRLRNAFRGQETIDESKSKWKKLATEHANYYVLSTYGTEVTDEQFTASGSADYEELIANDELLGTLQPFVQRRILEIGCGTGRMTEYIAKSFKEVYAVDIAEEMIERAQERLGAVPTIHLSATNGIHLPFPDNFFDIVFSFIVFQHMPDKQTVQQNIAEVVRVLRPGGRAKIQLRGTPVPKGTWYYGPAITAQEVTAMLAGQPAALIGTEGEGERYFWVWLEKR